MTKSQSHRLHRCLSANAVLEQVASGAASALSALGDDEREDPLVVLKELLDEGRLERLLSLIPERDHKFRTARFGRPQPVSVDLGALVMDWTMGHDLTQLADDHLSAVTDDGFRFEQLSDFLAKVCEHHLPWTLGIVLEWVAADSAVTFCQDVPTYVHYGVPNERAQALMTGGVRSRRLAVAVSRAADIDGVDRAGMRRWLADLGLQGWRERLESSPTEAADLKRFVRDNTKGLSAKLLQPEDVGLQLDTIAPDVEIGEVGTVEYVSHDEEFRALAVFDALGDEIAPIGAADQSELEILLGAGFTVRATVTSVGKAPSVTLRLDE